MISHEGSHQSDQEFSGGRPRPSPMVRRQHRQKPEQRGQRHRRASQELGRVHRFAGAEDEARDSGAELLPLQRRALRHRLYGGARAVDHERHRHRGGSRVHGRSGEFAQQFPAEGEDEGRQIVFQPLLTTDEGA